MPEMVEIVITGSINDALRASPAAKTCEDYENKKTQKCAFTPMEQLC
jgi:hypothetical protein